jgi:hypothetical protein
VQIVQHCQMNDAFMQQEASFAVDTGRLQREV